MTGNIGGSDRLLRVILGGALLALVNYGPQTAWGYIGVLPLLTGAFGWCPLYALLGISTIPQRRAQPPA